MKKNILFSTLAAIFIAGSVYFFSRPEPEEPPVVAQVEIPVLEVKEKLSSFRSEDWKDNYRGNLVEQIFQKALLDDPELKKQFDQLEALDDRLNSQDRQYYEVLSFYQAYESATEDLLKQLHDSTLARPVQLQMEAFSQLENRQLAGERIAAIATQRQLLQDRINLLKLSTTLTYAQAAVNLAQDEEANFLTLQEEVRAFLED